MIYQNILEMIGNTKLLKLERLSKKYGNNFYAKIESGNPFGSIKDRIALQIIKDAMDQDKINPDTIIVEPTSGNTGIGVAGICLYYGLKCKIVMPENMSIERVKLLKAYGAEVILTKKELGMKGSIQRAEEICKLQNNSFMPSQFTNLSNVKAHYLNTGREIIHELPGISYFFAGIGSGGTISGTGKYLKEQNSMIKVIGVEPLESAVLKGKPAGPHGIPGIGAGFKPQILNDRVIDEIIDVESVKAAQMTKEILKEEALMVGISSGACLRGAIQYLEENKLKNQEVVVIFPDSFERYLSLEE